MNFNEIERIYFERSHLSKAHHFLQKAGRKQFEALALFAGQRDGASFYVRETILPYQTSYKLENGLMYAVEGEELFRINTWLFNQRMQLIAQIHSHPREAYHSVTDDRYPIVDTYGGISIVVPNFAIGPVNIESWVIYRLYQETSWTALTSKEVGNLIKII